MNPTPENAIQDIMNEPPPIIMPPVDLAHDVYALASEIEGFQMETYQDIQHDQNVYDSFQRWPYLFMHALSNQ